MALDQDGEIKAPPPLALIVVVGVEVKEPSQESACCRFFTKCERDQYSKRRQALSCALSVKCETANGSRRRFCASAAHPFVKMHGLTLAEKFVSLLVSSEPDLRLPSSLALVARPAPPAYRA
ncbi:hypothetical protein [Bradyrhizobium sp.]|uniref:hypothetical protein n=1 Tax=Bradyrhizobium sp. TaxID=376 RepID=UPI003BAFDBA8